MAGGGFLRWYVGLLKSRPMTTNMGSALVMMSAGDVMAQELEFNNIMSGASENSVDVDDDDEIELNEKYNNSKQQRVYNIEDDNNKPRFLSNMMMTKTGSYNNNLQEIIDGVSANLEELDYYRTGSMVLWAVGAYTPFFVGVFKIFDKYMPKQTPRTIAIRLGVCFLLSIPINAAFFAYGSFAHHFKDYVQQQQQQQQQQSIQQQPQNSSTTTTNAPSPSLDWDQIWSSAQRKLDAELYTTITRSAVFWIPMNFLNFTMVQPHLRPLNLMFCSAFWNCYLSLAQHRDVPANEK